MGKVDKHGSENEDSDIAGKSSSSPETNGTEKLSLLKQMLLAGIDKRQKLDGIRRSQSCLKQELNVVAQKGEGACQAGDVNPEVHDTRKNEVSPKQKAERTKQKSESSKEKVDGTTLTQASTGQQKKRKKPKSSNDDSQKKERKKREAKEETQEEPAAKKLQKVVKEKEEEELIDESDSEDATDDIQYSPFSLCLEALHKNLQRKDVLGTFSFPAENSLTPGSSDNNGTSTDFLTMSRKISEQKYTSFVEFRDDFFGMCRDATLYYESGSKHHESATKLISAGKKMLSNKNIKKLSASIGGRSSNSNNTNYAQDKNCDAIFESETVLSCSKEDRQDIFTSSVLYAARKARETIMKRQSKVSSGCLSGKSGGTPALNILNPDTLAEDVPKRYTLGYSPAGRTFSRVYRRRPELADQKKDSKNNVVPVNYLLYGPYGSFGPTYDSSLSNLTKDESDILIHMYASKGDKDYIDDLGSYIDYNYVDGVLNALRSGNGNVPELQGEDLLIPRDQLNGISQENRQPHTALPTKRLQENTENVREKAECITEVAGKDDMKDVPSNLDLTSLLSLDELGINVSFLGDITKPSRLERKQRHAQCAEETIESKLSENAQLLNALRQSQHARFTTPGVETADIPTSEIKAATSITSNLKELIGMVKPEDVVSSQGVKKAIGSCEINAHIPRLDEVGTHEPSLKHLNEFRDEYRSNQF